MLKAKDINFIYLIIARKKVMQYNKHEFMTGVKKNYFGCIVKTKVDKVMASLKKGVKYMAMISSNT